MDERREEGRDTVTVRMEQNGNFNLTGGGGKKILLELTERKE